MPQKHSGERGTRFSILRMHYTFDLPFPLGPQKYTWFFLPPIYKVPTCKHQQCWLLRTTIKKQTVSLSSYKWKQNRVCVFVCVCVLWGGGGEMRLAGTNVCSLETTEIITNFFATPPSWAHKTLSCISDSQALGIRVFCTPRSGPPNHASALANPTLPMLKCQNS